MADSSLIQFHRVLIAAGILFCGGFAVWTFLAAARTGAAGLWILGGVFVLLAFALGYYLAHLRRFLDLGDDGER